MNDIRDLILAGVKWELDEKPCGVFIDKAQGIRHKADGTDETRMPTTHTEQPMPYALCPMPSSVQPVIIPPIKPTAIAETVMAAENAARAASDFDGLIRAIENFEHPLRLFSKKTIPPIMRAAPKIMAIIDAPNADDEATDKIMSGANGEMFYKMMGGLGLTTDDVAIVPLVFWRTPGGRSPLVDELTAARPLVNRAIELARPAAILTIGALASLEIAGLRLPRQMGEIAKTAAGIPVMPIFALDTMASNPASKRPVWNALQKLLKFLEENIQ